MAKKSTTTYDEDEDEGVKAGAIIDQPEVKEGEEATKEGEEAAPVGVQTITATLAEKSVTVSTADDVSKIKEGMSVSGEGITPGTLVVRTGEGAIVLDRAASMTKADVPLSIG